MARTRSTAGGRPVWLKDMYDIIDGKYDNDLDKMGRLLDDANKDVGEKGFVFTCSSPAMATKAVRAVKEAAEHHVELLEASVQALKAQSEEIQADVENKREVRDILAKSLEEACTEGGILQKQILEKIVKLIADNTEKTLSQRITDGEFNSLPFKQFLFILKLACAQDAALNAVAKKRDGGQQDEKDENSAGCPGQNCGPDGGGMKQK